MKNKYGLTPWQWIKNRYTFDIWFRGIVIALGIALVSTGLSLSICAISPHCRIVQEFSKVTP